MKNRESKTIRKFLFTKRAFPMLKVFLVPVLLILGFGSLFLVLTFSDMNVVFAQTDLPTSTCTDATDPETCQATESINVILNFLAVLVVPIVIIMIVVGGIQYSMAGNNPEAIKNARARIYKAVLALIVFISLWSFLKWLIPGGLE